MAIHYHYTHKAAQDHADELRKKGFDATPSINRRYRQGKPRYVVYSYRK